MTDKTKRLDVAAPGGVYLAPDGKTRQDANGNPLQAEAKTGAPKDGDKGEAK